MHEAATRAVTSFIFAPFSPATFSTFLQLNVSRENLVADTIRELAKFETADLKKPLKVWINKTVQHNIYFWSILFPCLLANIEKKNLGNMNIIEWNFRKSIISEGMAERKR